MKNLLLILGLIITNMGSLFAATSPQNLQSFLDDWRDQNHITSVVVSIEDTRTGKITDYTSGRVRLKGKPISTNNLYGIGSITKTFIAAAILKLQEQGKLKLTDQIGPYFPQYPRWKKVTIAQLLNMQSGIYNFTELPKFNNLSKTQKNIPSIDIINMAYAYKDYFAPGKGWHYSNTNYYLLGTLIEKSTGQPLSTVLSQKLLKPLHLNSTFYSDYFYSTAVKNKLAHAYANGSDVTNFNAGAYGPAGAMVMNSHDILTWTHALFTPGIILNKPSIQNLQHTVTIPYQAPRPQDSRYGLGVFSLYVPKLGMIWWYAGVIKGYTSAFVWIPSQHKIIAAQVASWPNGHYEVLFPNQILMQQLFKTIST